MPTSDSACSTASVEEIVERLTGEGVDWSVLLQALSPNPASVWVPSIPNSPLYENWWIVQAGLASWPNGFLTPLGHAVATRILLLQEWKNLCSTN